MFRELRRKKNEIGLDEAKRLLKTERRGVLSMIGDEGYPYGIPLNYFYSEAEGKIYFHGAREGHKVDSLRKCDKICFTVYGNEFSKEGEWAPYVQSAVVFGRCHMINDQDRAIELARKLAEKYYPDKSLIDEEIAKSGRSVQLFEIEIEHISGKQIQER